MSKIRQALTYEREIAKSQVEAHRELTADALAHERALTDQKIHEILQLQAEHRVYHDREHILYDDSVEKATSALRAQLAVLETDLDRLREASNSFLTVSRFEREHTTLIERIDTAIATLSEKLGSEEKVTVRQTAQSELLEKIAANNRWMITLLVGNGLTLIALIAHLAKLY